MTMRSMLLLSVALISTPLLAATPAPRATPTPTPTPPSGVSRDQALQNATREFALIDTNKDGKLSPDEIATFRRARVLAALRERNSRAFDRLDTDRNGSLSREEFAKLVPPEVKIDPAPLMKEVDKNGDGAISAAEWAAAAAANFSRRDADHNGVISPEEMRTPVQ